LAAEQGGERNVEHDRRLARGPGPDPAAPIAGHDDARLVAFHEAGHVVMCLLNRMLPTRVTIQREETPYGPTSGRVLYMRPLRRWFTRRSREIDVLLAGMVAEARYHGEHAASASKVDRKAALELALSETRSPARAERWIARRLVVVERRFADPVVWSATSRVAAALLARQTLVGHDLLELCSAVAHALHGRAVALVRWPGYATVAQTAFADGVGPEFAAARRAEWVWRAVFYVVVVVLGRIFAGH
jgi:hypothetical protein